MIISFITPVLNEEKYLNFLINRIDEKYNKFNFEWIFIDDHSTDESYRILSKFSNGKSKIKLFKNSGKGKIDAINLGVNNAQGKFIKLVGADDEIDLDFSKIGKGKFFYDIIYNPKETNFLKTAKKKGYSTENGKLMFLYQASSAFNTWHGIQPDISDEVIKLLD